MAKTFIVGLDAGHGGHDPGAVSGNIVEKTIALKTAFSVKKTLEEYGVKVVMVRTTDVYVDLSKRPIIANNARADVFVSVHYNAGGGTGAEAIHSIRNDGSKELAEKVVSSLNKNAGIPLRPKSVFSRKGSNGLDYYAVLRGAKMPAIIVEPAFVDSSDKSRIDSDEKLDKIGRAIALGILDYLKVSTKEVKKPVTETVKEPVKQQSKQSVKTTGVVNPDSLNVRQGPSVDHKVITTLKKGTKVYIVGQENGWYKISLSNNGYAYVGKSYIDLKTRIVVNCESLNVRETPSKDGKILSTLKKGEKVDILGEENGWLKISYKKESYGWVNGKYVD